MTAAVQGPELPEIELRGAESDDARALARLYRSERDFLAPFEPLRTERFFTADGQRDAIRRDQLAAEDDRRYAWLILADGEIVGLLTVSNVVRGAFENASLGYFVAQRHNGRGIATAAVSLACEWAFGLAGLHRLEAATLLDNRASQRVLARNGFRAVGFAPAYIRIAGEWRDHVLFARTCEDPARDVGLPDVERLREVMREEREAEASDN